MVLSQKSQYAVRAVFELAKRQGTGPVKASQVAEAEHIPIRFLEHILNQLRQAGIIESVRGKEGGYLLSRASKDISVGDVVRVIQGPVSDIECADPGRSAGCPLRPGCVLLPMWSKAHQAMVDVFDGTSFQDLFDQEVHSHECEALNYAI